MDIQTIVIVTVLVVVFLLGMVHVCGDRHCAQMSHQENASATHDVIEAVVSEGTQHIAENVVQFVPSTQGIARERNSVEPNILTLHFGKGDNDNAA